MTRNKIILTVFFIAGLAGLVHHSSAQNTSGPLDRWIQQQNKEYLRLLKKSPHEFKTLGIGAQSGYAASLEDAKFSSTVMMPEKIGMIIQTIMVSEEGNYSLSHQSGSSVKVNNIRHEEIGRFNYQGKVYVSVVSSLDKKEYMDDFAALNVVGKVQADALERVANKVLRHSTTGHADAFSQDELVQEWTEKCEEKYDKWSRKNDDQIAAMAWAYDKDQHLAYEKAKLLAGSLIPEKVEVYVEVVTQTLTKMGYSQQEITNTRISSLSKSKLKLSELRSDKLNQFKYNGNYFVSVIASKPKQDLDDLIQGAVKKETRLTKDFFETAGNSLAGYY